MKTKIEIKNRFTGKIIFEFETDNNTISKTVNEYVRKWKEDNGVFSRANLTDANLTDADLTDADLTDADLTDADLTRADLTRADLTRADLTRADLTRADLIRANLTRADLTRADLTRANLTRANLTRADLTPIKADFFLILLENKNEVSGLKEALINGNIDGSTYSGSCACLVGTIANVKHCNYDAIPITKPNSFRPAEKWFLGIRKDDTPENNVFAKLTLEWIEEFEILIK